MGRSNRLGIVVFTRGPLVPLNSVFFRRLAEDPLLEFAAIIVDEYKQPRKPLASRLLRGLREEGWAWLWFKAASGFDFLFRSIAVWIFERMHPRNGSEESYEMLQQQTGIPVYLVSDIHSEQSLALIRSLRPQLGVIVVGIFPQSVVTIPQYGTLNIHKRKVPEYRGGGPVGYWEVLAGELSIGITIHYATSRVDAGPVVNETTIPIEECDTLESLKIKADIVGARLYHETIRDFALGRRQGVPQDASRGRTYQSPSELAVWRLQKQLQRKAEKTMPSLRDQLPSPVARARVLLQYFILLPWLLYLRNWLIEQRQAPICIFYYHLVTNRPANHMSLPLEEFVKQIEFLRRYYKVVSLDEAVRRVNAEQSHEMTASITFDDGYRDNVWAIEYLRYFQIPAAFFVSIGHIRDGSSFEHDRKLGFHEAMPMREQDVRRLAADGFVVGSHGIYHEDFERLEPVTAERVLSQSRELIGQVTGRAPEHFSFPLGHRGTNITAENFALAKKHYGYVYSAYGGYNFPARDRRHFLRHGTPAGVLDLALIVDGYTGFRECLRGNAWGLKTDILLPY